MRGTARISQHHQDRVSHTLTRSRRRPPGALAPKGLGPQRSWGEASAQGNALGELAASNRIAVRFVQPIREGQRTPARGLRRIPIELPLEHEA